MQYSFRGGVRLDFHKKTRGKRIEVLPAPGTVTVPILNSENRAAEVFVSVGDTVAVGQPLGNAGGGLWCPVHAGVSGRVVDIRQGVDPLSGPYIGVVIENDGQDTPAPTVQPFAKSLQDATGEELLEVIRNAGILSMVTETLPVYAVIESSIGRVDRIIVNCTECEPYLTSTDRLLMENPAAVINGLKILLKVIGVRQAFLAVDNRCMDALNKLEKLLDGSKMIFGRAVDAKYPMEERTLLYAMTGRELPAGKTAVDAGCVMFRAETCAAVFQAFAFGMPYVRRVVTVAGNCIASPKNVSVPLGTSVQDLIAFCGGFRKSPASLVLGSPMTGCAVESTDQLITKDTVAVLALSRPTAENAASACIRCGRCVEVCPMHLMPHAIVRAAERGAWNRMDRLSVTACMECGSCSYICPGGVDVAAKVNAAKEEYRIYRASRVKVVAETVEESVEETVFPEEEILVPEMPDTAAEKAEPEIISVFGEDIAAVDNTSAPLSAGEELILTLDKKEDEAHEEK